MTRTILTVVRLRVLAGWRKALTEKAKLVFGVLFAGILIANYALSLSGVDESPFENVPVDILFAFVFLFVLASLLQVAPVTTHWFSRHEGAKFGLSVRRRTALAVATGLIGLPMALVLLTESYAVVFWGSGGPRKAEWALEGMDVVAAVLALVAAGPVGAVVMGGRGRKRWIGIGLGFLLLGLLAASALQPLWVGEAFGEVSGQASGEASGEPSGETLWAGAAVAGSRLALLLALAIGAFSLEQQSPDERGVRTKKRGGRSSAGKTGRGRPSAIVRRPPAGIWTRPTIVVALAEARMMLRFRQVRVTLVVSLAMPLFMVFMLRSEGMFGGEELPDGAGQFFLWAAAGLAAFAGVFWIAYFANLLGFTAEGARRLSMSAENALAACMSGKVLGTLVVAGVAVFVQTAVISVLLAERIPPADRAIPFLVAAFSLLGVALGGTVVSIWLPRKPKLHDQRDFYCSVLAMAALGCGWLVQIAIFGGVLAAARLAGGPRVATVTMTVLLLVAAAGCAAVVAALSRGDWLRRRLRKWAVTA